MKEKENTPKENTETKDDIDTLKIIKGLQDWVNSNYKPYACSWTFQRSEGHSSDCFEDGQENARSWAAYDIGQMLGMDLEEPDYSDEN